MFSTFVERGTSGLQRGCEVRRLQKGHWDKAIWVFSLNSCQAQMKMFRGKAYQIAFILWMQIIPKKLRHRRKRWNLFKLILIFFKNPWIYQSQVTSGFDITKVKLSCRFLALVQLCLWRKIGPYGSIWKNQKVNICGKVPPTGGIIINLAGPERTHVSRARTRATSLHGTGARFPCQDRWEPPGHPRGSGLVPGGGWGCRGAPRAPLPRRGALGSSETPRPPRSQWLRWRGAARDRVRDPPKLRPCTVLAHKPCWNSGGEAAFSHPTTSCSPSAWHHPGARGLASWERRGSCAAVCSASLLLVAWAIIKGLVRPILLQGFGTFLPISGAGAGCLCVRHNPVATSSAGPGAAESTLAVPRAP